MQIIAPFNETVTQVFARAAALKAELEGYGSEINQGLTNDDPRFIAVPDGYINLIPTDVRGLTFNRSPQQVGRSFTPENCPMQSFSADLPQTADSPQDHPIPSLRMLGNVSILQQQETSGLASSINCAADHQHCNWQWIRQLPLWRLLSGMAFAGFPFGNDFSHGPLLCAVLG